MRALALVPVLALPAFAGAQTPVTLSIDATQVAQYVLHAHEVMPASAGPAVIYFPKWIPGHHRPVGLINNLMGLHFFVNGNEVPWRRDDVEMTEFHLNFPPGTRQVEISFEEMERPGENGTANLSRICWDEVVLYPAGKPTDNIPIQADITLPAGWDYGTAMPVASQQGQHVQFQLDSLTRLVDSPMIIGKYFKKVPITTDQPPHELDIAADDPANLEIKPETVQAMKNLVAETGAMFGTRHYRDYHWLLTLSDRGGFKGLEHHESSEDGSGAKDLVNKDLGLADLLCHEYSHSWNGKFRRPVGLATPDYAAPMKGELLWVYEGLTEYLGTIFPARIGWWTAEDLRNALAGKAAYLDHRFGRTWRPLQDTAVSVQLTYGGSRAWNNTRRGADYYDEGVLIWLEADTIIRQGTNDAKSLNDFCRLFFGGPNNGPEVKPYTFDDVLSAMSSVYSYDWRTFFRSRLDQIGAGAPLGGIINSGWKLVYNDTPAKNESPFPYSLGMSINGDGTVTDVTPATPAYIAGFAPNMKIAKLNDKSYAEADLLDALKNKKPLVFTVDNLGTTQTITVSYTGGPVYPHLVRDDTKPDLLGRIISPYASH